jgi:hypothetical protein
LAEALGLLFQITPKRSERDTGRIRRLLGRFVRVHCNVFDVVKLVLLYRKIFYSRTLSGLKIRLPLNESVVQRTLFAVDHHQPLLAVLSETLSVPVIQGSTENIELALGGLFI